jgi:hypothetical protein
MKLVIFNYRSMSYRQQQIRRPNVRQPVQAEYNEKSAGSNVGGVRTDEAIKINKILNLLNDRLKTVEISVSQLNNNSNIEFDDKISLVKMNAIFSLMNSRISLLEKQNDVKMISTDLSKNSEPNLVAVNTVTVDNSENKEDESENIDTKNEMNFDELISNHFKILDIENNVSLLQNSVNNINVNGITNNFIKLTSLIQTIKGDLTQEITNIKKNISTSKNNELLNNNEINNNNENNGEPANNENNGEPANNETIESDILKNESENKEPEYVSEDENIKISLEDDNA